MVVPKPSLVIGVKVGFMSCEQHYPNQTQYETKKPILRGGFV